MRILLSNDDGVYSPGLAALEKQLRHFGEVFIAAPATEQSGVGHDHSLAKASRERSTGTPGAKQQRGRGNADLG